MDNPADKCANKVGFETKDQALSAVLVAEYQHGGKDYLSVYKCRTCGLYHLASA